MIAHRLSLSLCVVVIARSTFVRDDVAVVNLIVATSHSHSHHISHNSHTTSIKPRTRRIDDHSCYIPPHRNSSRAHRTKTRRGPHGAELGRRVKHFRGSEERGDCGPSVDTTTKISLTARTATVTIQNKTETETGTGTPGSRRTAKQTVRVDMLPIALLGESTTVRGEIPAHLPTYPPLMTSSNPTITPSTPIVPLPTLTLSLP